MAYCRHCGAPIADGTITCPQCGASQSSLPPVVDNGGLGWGILGCCIPIVGLVLWLVWKDQKPRTARPPVLEHWSLWALARCTMC